ncbi:MAG TPA: nucleoside monophosphate kinase, partial [Candidatus Pristimantibacillus sp.]|nr:nucleoside monophosphate kinase [Candidatus Pristimantibacillus sp.]
KWQNGAKIGRITAMITTEATASPAGLLRAYETAIINAGGTLVTGEAPSLMAAASAAFEASRQPSPWLTRCLGELASWVDYHQAVDEQWIDWAQREQKEIVSWSQAERGAIPEPRRGLIVVKGAPGSGKGTLAEDETLAGFWLHASTGAILRERGSDEQKARMKAGELLSDDEIIGIMDELLDSIDPNLLLSDGFPRTLKQAEWLVEQGKQGRFDPSRAVLLHVRAEKEACASRLRGRGRDDDNEAAIARRLAEDHELSEPVMAYLQANGFTLIEIDGNQAAEAAAQETFDRLFGSLSLAV